MQILDGHKVSNYLCAQLGWAWRAKLLKFEAIFRQTIPWKALFLGNEYQYIQGSSNDVNIGDAWS